MNVRGTHQQNFNNTKNNSKNKHAHILNMKEETKARLPKDRVKSDESLDISK